MVTKSNRSVHRDCPTSECHAGDISSLDGHRRRKPNCVIHQDVDTASPILDLAHTLLPFPLEGGVWHFVGVGLDSLQVISLQLAGRSLIVLSSLDT